MSKKNGTRKSDAQLDAEASAGHVKTDKPEVKSEASSPATRAPAVDVQKSVFPDHVTCLEEGKSFKTLRRHLNEVHGMTPEQYRAKWGLPANYPMVAPDYAETRSRISKETGLGRWRRHPE